MVRNESGNKFKRERTVKKWILVLVIIPIFFSCNPRKKEYPIEHLGYIVETLIDNNYVAVHAVITPKDTTYIIYNKHTGTMKVSKMEDQETIPEIWY